MRVLVTGNTGFVGTNLMDYLEEHLSDDYHLCEPDRHELRDPLSTAFMFAKHAPDIVVHLAARVGGIGANRHKPVNFFTDTMKMGMNVLHECYERNVYCILVGTVCSYPCDCPIPFKEENLWDGEPEITNSAYGVAKRGLYKLLWAYHQQHDLKGTVLLPTNMYGKHDSFDPRHSHVLPALMRKMDSHDKHVILWGTGKATREFLHVEDFCHAVLLTLQVRPNYPLPINIAGGDEISIAALADLMKEVTGFSGEIVFNHDMPDGQPRRKVDGTLAKEILGYEPTRALWYELPEIWRWYKQGMESCGTQK